MLMMSNPSNDVRRAAASGDPAVSPTPGAAGERRRDDVDAGSARLEHVSATSEALRVESQVVRSIRRVIDCLGEPRAGGGEAAPKEGNRADE